MAGRRWHQRRLTHVWIDHQNMGEGNMIKDTIGMLFVTAFVITFFTNAITDWNFWYLMARFGGQ
jgi:hypothetical protein